MSQIVVAKTWEGVPNPLANTDQPYLKFINTAVFQEDGRHFLRNGFYTSAPFGSKDYNDYWDLQEDRIMNGYEVGGVRVTGRHYFYLNFCMIRARPIDPLTGAEKKGENRKIITLPRFLDHNFYWFHEFEKHTAEGPHRGGPKKGMIIAKSRRKGFQQPNSTQVFTPDGPSTMGELKKDDYILGLNGKPTKVLEVFPQGKKDVYEVELFDGRKTQCGLEHLWEIHGRSGQGDREVKVVDTEFLLKENLKPSTAYTWYLPINDVIDYKQQELPIPSYTLGAILGDGNVTKQMKISGIDDELIERVINELNSSDIDGIYESKQAYKANWQIKFHTLNKKYWREYYGNVFAPNTNPLWEELKRLKLNVKSSEKYIPDIYKYSSVEQRYELVKGLMDTDGYISKDGAMTFANVSKKLVKDLQSVLYSLGISSTFRKRKDGLYIIYINTNKNIFHLSRKSIRVLKDRKSRNYIPIVSVKKLDYQEESSCISVDASDHLYLTTDYIPTHNTYQVTGGVYSYNFNFIPSSMNILAAYEKGHYKVTLDGIHFSMNHVNKATDWGKKRDKLNKRDHFRASFVMKNETTGVEIEDGYMSEIQAVSFKDNPFKSIGESTDLMGFEEAGKFEHLLTAYTISEPTFRDGDIITGTPLIWGTGGDMEKGTADFAEMYYDPEPYGLASYENIYDENATGDCGWFVDDMWYYPGSVRKTYYITDKWGKEIEKTEELPFVDDQGNSHRVLAEESLDDKRIKRRRGSRAAYNKFITQQPKTPAEAFLRVQGTMFDTIRASARLGMIMTNKKKFVDSIYKANLVVDPIAQKIKFEYNLTGIPLHSFPIKDNHQSGLIEIYEMPQKGENGEVAYGRYIAGIDPYDDDASTTNSVGSILVLDLLTDRIVCHYKGRPATADQFFETVRRILRFYNAIGNYERNKKGLYGYLYNKGQLNLLCDEPEILRDKGISKANIIGNNSKGTYASTGTILYGLQRSVEWMSATASGEEKEDEEGNPIPSEITNLDKIRSIPLIKETIAWNPEDNFDDISALIMLMIYREDRMQFKTHMREKRIAQITSDPFFDRHIGGASKSYSNKTMMDFIKTTNIKN